MFLLVSIRLILNHIYFEEIRVTGALVIINREILRRIMDLGASCYGRRYLTTVRHRKTETEHGRNIEFIAIVTSTWAIAEE